MARRQALIICLLGLVVSPVYGQHQLREKERTAVLGRLEDKAMHYGEIAHRIWDLAELGFLEDESVKLLARPLAAEGFEITWGVAGMPTAFVASWGNGAPIIATLAEYDALPKMSQEAVPYPLPRKEGGSGHACGHHLFGVGSVAAAIAVKQWLETSGTVGTIRLYGTPAEEGGGGKIYMVRAGLFDDVDGVLSWHPASTNTAEAGSSLAAVSVNFEFSGYASHAAAAPERGRSALDGVEALNYMVNLMREHVPSDSRIHYTIQDGGGAANVVPASASVSYIIRNPDMRITKEILQRVIKAAEGATMGTETTMTYELETGYFNKLPNETLARVMHEQLNLVGGVSYDDAERQFATEIIKSFKGGDFDPSDASKIQPFRVQARGGRGSTDVGDISWVVPTTGMRAATWVPGTSAHSWQAVAAGGMSIGRKGMMVAAKTLTLSAIHLFQNPSLLEKAEAELLERRGADFTYESLVGDREPPLDYRK